MKEVADIVSATIHYNVTKASDQLGLRHEWSKAAPDEPWRYCVAAGLVMWSWYLLLLIPASCPLTVAQHSSHMYMSHFHVILLLPIAGSLSKPVHVHQVYYVLYTIPSLFYKFSCRSYSFICHLYYRKHMNGNVYYCTWLTLTISFTVA